MFCLSSGKKKKKCASNANAFPTHCLSGVYLSRTHQYCSASRSLPLLSLLPSHPATPSGGSIVSCFFLFSSKRASGLLCVKVLLTVSSVFRPLAICSLCPPTVSLLLLLSFLCFFDPFCHPYSSFFFLLLLLSFPVLFRTWLFFFSTVLFCSVLHSFLSSCLLLCLTGSPHNERAWTRMHFCKIRGLQTISCGVHVEACGWVS